MSNEIPNIIPIKCFDRNLVRVEFIDRDQTFGFHNISEIKLVSGKYVNMISAEFSFWMPANLQFTITKESGVE